MALSTLFFFLITCLAAGASVTGAAPALNQTLVVVP